MDVSYFDNVRDNKPKKYSLDNWIEDTFNPPIQLKKQIRLYRETKDKKYKSNLPCATISATFNDVRNLDNVKEINGFIVIDIDREAKAKNKVSNTCLDMKLAKQLLSKHPSVYYCGYSCSNDGIYAIIKINPKKPLIKYFKLLKKSLKLKGIYIDESCKDITRLRFLSYDKKGYYNKKAIPLQLPKKRKVKKYNPVNAKKSDIDKVDALLATVECTGIDITSDYSDWIKIAAGLYNLLGENGRDYFHRFSKYNSEYKFKKADNKFNSCRNMNKTGIGSLFYICSSYGVRF